MIWQYFKWEKNILTMLISWLSNLTFASLKSRLKKVHVNYDSHFFSVVKTSPTKIQWSCIKLPFIWHQKGFWKMLERPSNVPFLNAIFKSANFRQGTSCTMRGHTQSSKWIFNKSCQHFYFDYYSEKKYVFAKLGRGGGKAKPDIIYSFACLFCCIS